MVLQYLEDYALNIGFVRIVLSAVGCAHCVTEIAFANLSSVLRKR